MVEVQIDEVVLQKQELQKHLKPLESFEELVDLLCSSLTLLGIRHRLVVDERSIMFELVREK